MVVSPQWILDSISRGSLQPCARYQVYHREGPFQQRLATDTTPAPAHAGPLCVDDDMEVECAHEADSDPDMALEGILSEIQGGAADEEMPAAAPTGKASASAAMASPSPPRAAHAANPYKALRHGKGRSKTPTSAAAPGYASAGSVASARKRSSSSTTGNALSRSEAGIPVDLDTRTSAGNPQFMEQFYQQSRLHHLSTYGVCVCVCVCVCE